MWRRNTEVDDAAVEAAADCPDPDYATTDYDPIADQLAQRQEATR